MKEFLKQHEEYLDKIAIEVMLRIVEQRPPTSPDDSANISSIAYKQALAMLDAKMSIDKILNKTKFLMKERIASKNKQEQ